ncbi:MAG: S1/P1 Nuclease [Bacteroidetes bacterium]|nr:MAG: S1/P1 Nuclease [Bacteroidota bacterium]
MKKWIPRKITLTVLLFFTFIGVLFAWGEWGHQHINRAAVFALPEEMRVFFYNHIDFITDEAVVPDLRKYSINDKAEFARHFIDVENFGNNPVDSLPRTMKDALVKYPDSFLQRNGILPWYIQDMMTKLTTAFKNRRTTEIIFLAADLGHYLGDANMPLHTAVNHDGQFTDQKGIHAFWESQIPELFGNNYNFNTGPALYINDIQKETFRIIADSHGNIDTLLSIEKNLKASYDKSKMYVLDSAGNITRNKFNQPVHTYEYAKAYHDALHGMVERQLRKAITATANFWYTAWVNAGKPNLNDLDSREMTDRNEKNLNKEYKLWEKGKLFGFKTDKEF